jgi:hypothetical protein
MLAIDALDKESRQELADKVHQMQVNGEIWGDKVDRPFHISTINLVLRLVKTRLSILHRR